MKACDMCGYDHDYKTSRCGKGLPPKEVALLREFHAAVQKIQGHAPCPCEGPYYQPWVDATEEVDRLLPRIKEMLK